MLSVWHRYVCEQSSWDKRVIYQIGDLSYMAHGAPPKPLSLIPPIVAPSMRLCRQPWKYSNRSYLLTSAVPLSFELGVSVLVQEPHLCCQCYEAGACHQLHTGEKLLLYQSSFQEKPGLLICSVGFHAHQFGHKMSL